MILFTATFEYLYKALSLHPMSLGGGEAICYQ